MKQLFLALLVVVPIMLGLSFCANANATKTKYIAALKNEHVYIYDKAKATAKKQKAADRADYSYYVNEKSNDFYRLQEGKKVIGWVKKADVKLYERKAITEKKDTAYVIGIDYSYSMPLGRNTEVAYDLTQYVAKKIAITEKEVIGSTTWYKAKLGSEYAWFKESTITTNAYAALDLHKKSSMTAKQMQTFLLLKGKTADNILYKLAPAFIEAQKHTGINAQFMLAHAILETGWGSSVISQYKNNFFGYQAYDSCPVTCAKYFPSGTKGLEYYAYKIHTNYLSKNGPYYNGPTALGMNVRYASDRYWAVKIATLMAQMKPYDAKEYAKKKASTFKLKQPPEYDYVIPAKKAQPVHFKKMPPNMTATATQKLNVYAMPYSTAKVLGSYQQKQKIKLVAYHSDVRDITVTTTKKARWYRIKYNGKQGWVRSDQLSTPSLGFMSATTPARANAGTKYKKVSEALAYTPIQFALQNGKKVTKKDSNGTTWYKVYLTSAPKTAVWVDARNVLIY